MPYCDVLGRIRHWTQQADAATPQVFTMDCDSEDQLLNAVLGPSGGKATASAHRITSSTFSRWYIW